MKINLDPILRLIPHIEKPKGPLSFREKLRNTGIILLIYFIMFSTPAIGASINSSPALQIINIIFAARIGTLVTIGIGPIVLASIILQLLSGAGIINIDLNNPEEKGRFQSIQKLMAIIIAFVEAYIYVFTGYVPVINASLAFLVFLQLAIGAIIIIYLDEAMTKYGITSGINLFIASGVSYAIIAGTIEIVLPNVMQSFTTGGAAAISYALLNSLPIIFTIIIMLISIYIMNINVEIPIVFTQLRGVGGKFPIPLLYVSVLPVILALSLIISLDVWFRPLASIPAARFFAYYAPVPNGNTSVLTLEGGLLYLISPPPVEPYSIGYNSYIQFFLTSSSKLYLFGNNYINVPEWLHAIIFTVVLVLLCIVFGKFWVEMTGQNPKNIAEQLKEIGWQIPGFRRDPRIIESLLERYIPIITILGSIIVGLLAAFATLVGAIGSGMGILLDVAIINALYMQFEQEKELETLPFLNKLTK